MKYRVSCGSFWPGIDLIIMIKVKKELEAKNYRRTIEIEEKENMIHVMDCYEPYGNEPGCFRLIEVPKSLFMEFIKELTNENWV